MHSAVRAKMLVGIVGKASCGKSTFFRAATLAEAEIASYPFTTIKANHGIAFVKLECADREFKVQCNPRTGFCLNHKRFVPVELMDVAGLIPGAHEGLGLGNQFLDDLRQADVFIHIVDASGSTNEKGEAVEAMSYDPCKDVEFIEEELDLWFLRLVNKGWDKFTRQIKQESSDLKKAIAKQLSGLGVTEPIAEEVLRGFDSSISSWNANEIFRFARALRKRTKPMIVFANKIDVPGAEKNVKRLRERFSEYTFVAGSAESELVLREAAKKWLVEYIPGESDFSVLKNVNEKQAEALKFIKENILKKYKSTGVQDVLNRAVFGLLKYVPVFPGGINKLEDSEGRVLPDCFLMREGSTALDFAYRLHTDLGDKFIRAIDVKRKLTVGKEYKLRFGDVIEIVSGR